MARPTKSVRGATFKKKKSPPPAGISIRLKDARENTGMTQAELARKSGLSPALLSSLERKDKNTYAGVLLRLASALDVSADWLLGLSKDQHIHARKVAYEIRRIDTPHMVGREYLVPVADLKGRPGSGDLNSRAEAWLEAHNIPDRGDMVAAPTRIVGGKPTMISVKVFDWL
jgi:transcriptional regulator with XRE-family HTH domain